jgi:hypothetical protein
MAQADNFAAQALSDGNAVAGTQALTMLACARKAPGVTAAADWAEQRRAKRVVLYASAEGLRVFAGRAWRRFRCVGRANCLWFSNSQIPLPRQDRTQPRPLLALPS